jgi:NADH-quinone oxidoreductase subunit G
VPHLAAIDEVPVNEMAGAAHRARSGKADFVPAITDHYLVNPIARASTLMAELSAAAKARAAAPMAAE